MSRIILIIGMLILLSSFSNIVVAQDFERKSEEEVFTPKKPLLALGLGLVIPGGGHLYAGEVKTGLTVLGVGSAGAAIIVASTQHAQSKGDVRSYVNAGFYSAAGSIVMLGAYLYSAIDAPKAARRTNQKYGYNTKRVRVEPTLLTTERTKATYGLKVRVRL